jgi:peptidoglycan hydrolase-like protein with peptidoglycan-binding domain
VQPLFTAYCDGRRVSCDGLSQWGSVDLAEQGYTPYEILQYYYGDDIDIVSDVPVGPLRESAPTIPLRRGSVNDNVRTVQLRLNRIGRNYPSIPKIPEPDGIFGTQTEAAVKRFQEIFGLTSDGVVGRATWYYIRRIYNAVRRLNEIDGEGVTLEEVTAQYPGTLREGDVSLGVLNLQYFINYLSGYYSTVPPLAVDGTFGPATRAAVIDVQNTFGLPADGIVGEITWEAIYDAYLGIVTTIPLTFTEGQSVPFPGVVLRVGASGDDVRLLQEYLAAISTVFPRIPALTPDGAFGPRTRDAVIAFQEEFGLPINGRVGAITWAAIADIYEDIAGGAELAEGQYPGTELGR